MTTIALAAQTDNAQEHASNGTVDTPSSSTASLYVDPDDADAPKKFIGLRYAIPIPPDAIIQSCFIRCTLTDTAKNDASGNWYVQQVADAAAFTAGAGNTDVSERIGGTAVEWSTNDLGSVGDAVDTPSLVALLQGRVDDASWATNNNVAFIFTQDIDNDDLSIGAHGNTTRTPPVLHVTWQQNVATSIVQPTQIFQPAITTITNITTNLLLATSLFAPSVSPGAVNIATNVLSVTTIYTPSVTPPTSGAQFTETFPGTGDLTGAGHDLSWLAIQGGASRWPVAGGTATLTQDGTTVAWVTANHAVDTDDNETEVEIVNLARGGGFVEVDAVCRAATPSSGDVNTADGYSVIVAFSNQAQATASIRRYVNGAATTIAGPTNVTLSFPEVWKISAEGSTITSYRNDVQFAQVTDTTITTGKYGALRGFNAVSVGNAVEVDNWSVRDVGAVGDQNINTNLLSVTAIYQPAVTVGAVNVEANFIQPTQLYEPAVQYQIAPHVVQPTTIFEPTIQVGAVNVEAQTVTPTTIFQPAIQTGAVNIATELLSQTAIYEPSITTSIDVETNLLQITAIYEPSITVGSVNIAPQLLAQTTIHNPAITVGAVNIGVEFVEPTSIFQPSVEQASIDQNVETNFLQVTALYEPGVQYQILIADVLSPTVLYQPAIQVGAVSINAHSITPTIVFEPAVTVSAVNVETDLLTPTTIHEPAVQYEIVVELLSPTVLFDPAIAAGAVNIAPDVVQPTVLFDPAVETGEASIETELLTSTVIYTPASVFIGIAAPFLQVTQIFTPSEVLSSGGQGAIVLVFDDTPIGF